ncbi:hypothetical protein HDF17_000097 [Granulicella arctica]|uniref:Uncharacterized protein n=1 Tax=Granulicella arctica TaxID=940613 RepID=A0A7Y9PDA2_9BACT|nr:hypothetical protein [Granulicella arctica]
MAETQITNCRMMASMGLNLFDSGGVLKSDAPCSAKCSFTNTDLLFLAHYIAAID